MAALGGFHISSWSQAIYNAVVQAYNGGAGNKYVKVVGGAIDSSYIDQVKSACPGLYIIYRPYVPESAYFRSQYVGASVDDLRGYISNNVGKASFVETFWNEPSYVNDTYSGYSYPGSRYVPARNGLNGVQLVAYQNNDFINLCEDTTGFYRAPIILSFAAGNPTNGNTWGDLGQNGSRDSTCLQTVCQRVNGFAYGGISTHPYWTNCGPTNCQRYTQDRDIPECDGDGSANFPPHTWLKTIRRFATEAGFNASSTNGWQAQVPIGANCAPNDPTCYANYCIAVGNSFRSRVSTKHGCTAFQCITIFCIGSQDPQFASFNMDTGPQPLAMSTYASQLATGNG